MTNAPENWRARLRAAEEQRAGNTSHWSERLPRIYADELLPAVRDFHEALAAQVSAAVIDNAALMQVNIRFDDWHLDEWSLQVRLVPTVLDHALLEIGCAGEPQRRYPLEKSAGFDRERFLGWLTDAYIARTQRLPGGSARVALEPDD